MSRLPGRQPQCVLGGGEGEEGRGLPSRALPQVPRGLGEVPLPAPQRVLTGVGKLGRLHTPSRQPLDEGCWSPGPSGFAQALGAGAGPLHLAVRQQVCAGVLRASESPPA